MQLREMSCRGIYLLVSLNLSHLHIFTGLYSSKTANTSEEGRAIEIATAQAEKRAENRDKLLNPEGLRTP